MVVVVQLAAVLVDEEVTEDPGAEVLVGADVDEDIKVESGIGVEEEVVWIERVVDGVYVIGLTVA